MEQTFQPYRTGRIRFLVLFLASMAVFGNQPYKNICKQIYTSIILNSNYYTPSSPSPTSSPLSFIGFLIDYLGVRVGIILLSAGVVIFQLVVAAGGYAYNFTTILIGRMLFGLASVSLGTAQASLVSFWFQGKQLAFALGIALTFPQLGNALNSYASPMIYEASGSLGTPLLVSVFVCLISLICAVGAAYMDFIADKYDEQHKIRVVQSHKDLDVKEQIKCQDLKFFTLTFWLLVTLSMFGEGLYGTFMDGANKLFIERFCFTPVGAGRALMVTYIVAAVFSAPLGLLIDKVGYKRYFVILCMGVFTLAQLIILEYPQCAQGQSHQNGAIAGLAFLGFGCCLYGNSILPSISLVVKKKNYGTAFGITTMIQCIASSFFPLINGAIIEAGNKNHNNYRGYIFSSVFFVVIGCLGILTSLSLLFIPEKFKKRLDRASKQQMKAVRHGQKGELYFTTSDVYESQSQSVSIGREIQIATTDDLTSGLLKSCQPDNKDL